MKNSDLRGRIHSFETFGAVDGPGMRFVVFFQGCPLRCVFCHNPDTWDPSGGTEYTVEQVVQRVLPYREFYRGGGVTLSGGEPLAQHEFAAGLMERLRSEGLHTALDTSAGVPLDLCRPALEQADMLLLDFKGFSDDLSRRLTGREGVLSREKEYLEYCEERGKTVWVRYVLVPGMTMDRSMLRALGEYLRGGVNDALAAAVGIKDPKILIDGGVNEYGAEYGLCRYGELEEEMELGDFLARVKENLRPNGIRYNSCGKKVRRVAQLGRRRGIE